MGLIHFTFPCAAERLLRLTMSALSLAAFVCLAYIFLGNKMPGAKRIREIKLGIRVELKKS